MTGVGERTREQPLRLARGLWTAVEQDTWPAAVVRSALDAARTVLDAQFCCFAWQPAGGEPVVTASQGISERRARERAAAWLATVGVVAGEPVRPAPQLRVEPVADAAGGVRGAFVAAFTGAGAHSPDARVLMPVFASHLGLLTERSAAQALRTRSYEALVQIGMEIQAAEADVDQALELIVRLARELIGTELAWVGLVDEATRTLEMAVASGATTRPFMEMRLRLGDGVGGVVVASARPVALPDYRRESLPTPPDVRAAVLGEGVASMLSTPMLRGERVIGVLYVGSRRPMEFSSTTIALVSALAAQAAIAVDNGRLYAALQRNNALLEETFTVHRTLTDAALAGSGPRELCARLARLVGADVSLAQDVVEPFHWRCTHDGRPAGTAADDDGLSFPIVGDVELGRITIHGVERLTPLQAKAAEHGATVLALELLKLRAAQEAAWQLQGDLLNELLDAPSPPPPTLGSRARRHGIDLKRAHRIVAVTPASDDPLTPSGERLLALVRRVTGRSGVPRDAALVNLRGEHVVLAHAENGSCASLVHAIGAAAERSGGRLAIGVGEAGADFAAGYRQAVACSALARGDGQRTRVLHADELGPLRFVLNAPDTEPLRALVREQLGSIADRAEQLATLRAFVTADGNVAVAAEALCVHKNTLRYRLQRAGAVLGRDPAAADVKFELRIAFGLLDLFESLGVDLLAV